MKVGNTTFLRSLILLVFFITACSNEDSRKDPSLTAAQAARQAGLEYLNQNKLAEAEAEFTKLIKLAPDEIIGYVNLGIVYMRQGKTDEAEIYFGKALEINDQEVTVRLNLFELYELMDQPEKALSELEAVLEFDPDNLYALYKMSERSEIEPENSMSSFPEYLNRIIEVAPTNIVPRMYLLEYLLENKKSDEALEQFEEIESKFERLPTELAVFFDQAYEYLRNSATNDSYLELVRFHNHLKLTNWYQADNRALRGSEYSQIGIPVISFSRKMIGFGGEDQNLVYQNIAFNEVAENAGLSIHNAGALTNQSGSSWVAVNDLDNDGDQDLLIGSNGSQGQNLFVFRNELGRFDEVSSTTGIPNQQKAEMGFFSDYDNDGFLDLVLLSDGKLKLYRNVDELRYEDVTNQSGLEAVVNGTCILFFDSDHDGDLDLFVGTTKQDVLFQNNGNGSFSDVTQQRGIDEVVGITYQAVLDDFDDDGDIDFFITNEKGNRLYANSRMGVFQDVSASMGISATLASKFVSSGDYNNDGYADLLLSDVNGAVMLYKNQGKLKFAADPVFVNTTELNSLNWGSHSFFDFDNDGSLDIVAASGDPGQERGLLLLRNTQQAFEEVPSLIPSPIEPVRSLAIGDYNEDGDLDLFLNYYSGKFGLLRNDGGNMNYQLKLQLVGLREGSGKNNYYGIGSKVEVRAGSTYQMKTITSPIEYFGLGSHERADILRIRWTNGVPQNIFAPHSDRDLVEQQKLKGSCPFLYAWNGDQYVFVKDMMWRSALGMPLGIMNSDRNRTYAFPDASREYLKIPGELLQLKDGEYHLKVTGELWETIYLDELVLFAVDHPSENEFLLDEKFIAPPFPELDLYQFTKQHLPVSVTDGRNDQLAKVSAKDNNYIENFKKSKYQGVTELKDLIIDLGDQIPTEHLHLFLNGWIFPSDASLNVAMSQSMEVQAIPPYLQVRNESGEWVTVIENLGFPLGKNKTMVTDLSNVFKTSSRQIRIRTSMQIYWDHIFYGYVDDSLQHRITPLENYQSNLQYRGFSEEFRKNGRNGPHWFDFTEVSTEPKWMDLEGLYTRYGDVTPLLKSSDNQYIIYNAGDEISIRYSAKDLEKLPKGWKRDFVIYSVGWVKDGDLNTAYGQTVYPLPFHGMSSYPYPESEQYPFQELSEYINEYNTRMVNSDPYKNLIKSP